MRSTWEPRLQYSAVAAAGLVIGAGSAIYSGLSQRKQAKALAANNPYPTQTVPQADLDNQQLAKQMANQGLPAQQYANAMTNIQRTQQSAMRNGYDRRGGLGLIGQIQQNSNDATAKLDAANAAARIQNQRQLLGVNRQVAGAQQDAFNWNSKNKYLQNYNYSQQLQGAGNANLVHGVDEIGSGLIQGAARGLFSGGSARIPSTTGNGLTTMTSPNRTDVNTGNYNTPNVFAPSPGIPGYMAPMNFQYQNPYSPLPGT